MEDLIKQFDGALRDKCCIGVEELHCLVLLQHSAQPTHEVVFVAVFRKDLLPHLQSAVGLQLLVQLVLLEAVTFNKRDCSTPELL